MKVIIAVLLLLSLASCDVQPTKTVKSEDGRSAELILEIDGTKTYRFWDLGQVIYVTTYPCSDTIQHQIQVPGKY